MFTIIIKELLETEIAECNETYSQTLIDDEYERSNIASQKESRSILVKSILITLHNYSHLSATKYTVDLIVMH